MKKFADRFATPAMTGLFLVSGVSGIALFFHWMPSLFHGMHAWLSMILFIPFVFHMWKNWNALVGYFHRKTLALPIAVSFLAAAAFAFSALNAAPGGNPAFRALPLLSHARLIDLAPILHTTADDLAETLRQRGMTVTSNEETLDAVAARADTSANQLLLALLPPNSAR